MARITAIQANDVTTGCCRGQASGAGIKLGIGNALPAMDDGKLVGKNGGEQIFGFHPLEGRVRTPGVGQAAGEEVHLRRSWRQEQDRLCPRGWLAQARERR